MNNFKTYFALEKRLKSNGFRVDRKELVETFTDGKKTGLSKLSYSEYGAFISWISSRFDFGKTEDWQNSPENKMRRKIWKLFVYQMKYSEAELENWCLTYGLFKKPLNQHTHDELTQLLSQAEIVYQSFIKGLRK